MRNVSDKGVEKNQNTHFTSMFSSFFFYINFSIFVLMWKSVVQSDRPQVTT